MKYQGTVTEGLFNQQYHQSVAQFGYYKLVAVDDAIKDIMATICIKETSYSLKDFMIVLNKRYENLGPVYWFHYKNILKHRFRIKYIEDEDEKDFVWEVRLKNQRKKVRITLNGKK